MSAKQEHRKRYNLKIAYAHEVELWARKEPPRWRLIAWRKWLNSRPTIKF